MKIAYILISDNLECDDRIRKEMFTIRELVKDVEFKIFAFAGLNNRAETGILSYGVPYEYVFVKHREGKKKNILSMFLKEYSFYSQVASKVKDFDLLWVCDEQPFFFPLFSKKPVIWDLHEVPEPLIGSRLKNILFRRMERRCKWLIHANQERLDYLNGLGLIKHLDKNVIIHNYPDLKWKEEAARPSEAYNKFAMWLQGEDYVYIQGIDSADRFAWETLSTIMDIHCIKAVVIGRVPTAIINEVKTKYHNIDRYIYFTGVISQSETASFISHCKFSLVFYIVTKNANNRYCEPNRLFQSLGFGKPVVTGCNEPMRNVVQKYGNGIAMETDGSVIVDNVNAVKTLLNNYSLYLTNAINNKDEFLWEKQNNVFKLLIDGSMSK